MNVQGEPVPEYNPFSRKPGLAEKIEIFRKARSFSDDLMRRYDEGGEYYPYFIKMNRDLTTKLAILIMVTYPWLHDGKEPDVRALQEVINDFSALRKYLYALARMEGIADDIATEDDVTYEWVKTKSFGEYRFIVEQLVKELMGDGSVQMEKKIIGLRIMINEYVKDYDACMPRARKNKRDYIVFE